MLFPSKRPQGFTIIELLIVIVIIAILAAITLVVYNGIQARAQDSAMRENLVNIAKQFASYQIINSVYPSNQTSGIKFPYSPVGQNAISCLSQTDPSAGFAIVAKDVSGSGQWYAYESTTSQTSIVTPAGVSGANLCATTIHPAYSWAAFWVVGG